MKYGGKRRLLLAWRWLPVEVLIIGISLVVGFMLVRVMSKPVYQANLNIKIERRLPKKASSKQRTEQLKKDVKSLGQFSVMPHQVGVLVTANNYAYSRFGTIQQLQDLSESVTAVQVTNKPILKITVNSSSRIIARQNAEAFEYALNNTLKSLSNYNILITTGKVNKKQNIMMKPMLKFFGVVGVGLAIVTPYIVDYIRGEGCDRSV